MIPLYIFYYEYRTGGDKIHPDEEWSSREDEEIELELERCSFDVSWIDNIQVPEEYRNADYLFLVVARYSDGNTFGRTNGHYYFCKAFDNIESAKQYNPNIEVPKENKWCPWNGYFGSKMARKEIYCFNMKWKGGFCEGKVC